MELSKRPPLFPRLEMLMNERWERMMELRQERTQEWIDELAQRIRLLLGSGGVVVDPLAMLHDQSPLFLVSITRHPSPCGLPGCIKVIPSGAYRVVLSSALGRESETLDPCAFCMA